MIEKQHLFSLTEDFLKYLNKQKIYNINLTHKINKAYKYDYEIKQQEAHILEQNQSYSRRTFKLPNNEIYQNQQEPQQQEFKLPIEVYTPDHQAVANLVTKKGPNSFYDSVNNRKECCAVRKIEPLKRALKGNDVWITGLRQGQSQNRAELAFFEYDTAFDIIKFNPLLHWSLDDVKTYLNLYKVPQNSLHKKGFVSIGCAPCTRAIAPGEDIRAGRWWWETSKKECGLHITKS